MYRIVYPSDWQVVGVQPRILVHADDDARRMEVVVLKLSDFNVLGAHAVTRARVALERATRWLEGRVQAPLREGKYVLCLSDAQSRRVFGFSGIHVSAAVDRWAAAFDRMLKARLAVSRDRSASRRAPGTAPLFSITTTVYDTDPLYFHALADCLREQIFGDFEWLVLDNGSTSGATIEAMREVASRDERVRLFRVEQNLHIIGGNRYLLERARGRFVVPVDSDDLVYADALAVLAAHCARPDAEALYFSDEQKVSPTGESAELMWRPAWSGLYALATCPASHLMAFDRQKALAVGAYSEEYARGSHDWDTILRLADAGARPVRVAEVLYGWRMHPQSAALSEAAKDYVRASQEGVLMHSLERRGLAQRFALEPAIPSLGYYHFVRRPIAPRPIAVDFVLRSAHREDFSTLLHNVARIGYPEAQVRVLQVGRAHSLRLALLRRRCPELRWEVVKDSALGASVSEVPTGAYAKAIVDCAQALADPRWLWDALGTLELDGDTGIVTGPILDPRGRIRSIGYVAGLDGFFGTPAPGEPPPAAFGTIGLLRRHVSAAHSGFLVMRADARAIAGPLEGVDDADALYGIDFCMRAAAHGLRTAFTPLMKATRARALQFPVGASDQARRERLAGAGPDPYYARYLVRESRRYGELEPGACS